MHTIFVNVLVRQATLVLAQRAQEAGEETAVPRAAGMAAGVLCSTAKIVVVLSVTACRVGAALGNWSKASVGMHQKKVRTKV